MKNLKMIIMGLLAGNLVLSCEKAESNKTTCDSKNGIEVTAQIGRIYKWAKSKPHFFYIGNVTPVSTGNNGGYIPCNDLQAEFQIEGIVVQYSGIDKGSLPYTNDPLFAFITLTEIKKTQ